MLTEATTNAVAIIESVDPSRSGSLEAALDALAGRVSELMGATVIRRAMVTREAPAITLEAAPDVRVEARDHA
jgi:DNA/RNA-binding domain of Phe-tRNA-synthetase-like protein